MSGERNNAVDNTIEIETVHTTHVNGTTVETTKTTEVDLNGATIETTKTVEISVTKSNDTPSTREGNLYSDVVKELSERAPDNDDDRTSLNSSSIKNGTDGRSMESRDPENDLRSSTRSRSSVGSARVSVKSGGSGGPDNYYAELENNNHRESYKDEEYENVTEDVTEEETVTTITVTKTEVEHVADNYDYVTAEDVNDVEYDAKYESVVDELNNEFNTHRDDASDKISSRRSSKSSSSDKDETYANVEEDDIMHNRNEEHDKEQAIKQQLIDELKLEVKDRKKEDIIEDTFTDPSPSQPVVMRQKEETGSENMKRSSHIVSPTASSEGPTTSTSKRHSTGTFVMRSVNKADAFHVLQCMSQGGNTTLETFDPEQDELVTYLKGDEGAGAFVKNKIRSMITSPLVRQFNKESQNGEAGQNFIPKTVLVSSTSSHVTNDSKSVTVNATKVESSSNDVNVTKVTVDTPNAEVKITKVEKSNDTTVDNKNDKSIKVTSVEVEKDKENDKTADKVVKITTKSVTKAPTEPMKVEVSSLYAKPPIEKHSTTTETKQASQSNTVTSPSWISEVEKRRQINQFVGAKANKVDQPRKLAEVPEWKKALVEKNKLKKSTSEDSNGSLTSPTSVLQNTDAEWKAEIKKVLQQRSLVEEEEHEKPEWLKLAEAKK